jgi:hypothetical protein
MLGRKIILLVIGPNSKNSSGNATIRNFSKSARIISGLKRAIFCVLGSVIFFFIPVIHLIMVPALHIAAVVSFIFAYRKIGDILEASARCPLCSAELNIKNAEPNWPLGVVCSNCSAQLYIQDAALEPLISISTQPD